MLGVYCGSLGPHGCQARAIICVQSSSVISNSTGPTAGRPGGDRPPTSGHGGRDTQGLGTHLVKYVSLLGTHLVDSVLDMLRHPMGAEKPMGAQAQGNNRRPSRIGTTSHTASTASSCSGQGTPISPGRGRLYIFPASDGTVSSSGKSAAGYSI